MMDDTGQTSKRALASDGETKNRYRIDVKPAHSTSRGRSFDVTFNGKVILRSINPTADACRYLVANGYAGSLETWGGEPYPRIIVPDIAVMAAVTVGESDKQGPRIARYKPFDRGVFEKQAAE